MTTGSNRNGQNALKKKIDPKPHRKSVVHQTLSLILDQRVLKNDKP
jgi:hypothetical protein